MEIEFASNSAAPRHSSLFVFSAVTAGAATFDVTTTADSGAGSFRQAIIDANGMVGQDTITFHIPGGGVHTITPVTDLPSITDRVIIDGYSQPGASPNTLANGDNAVLLIEINGSGSGINFGLNLASGASGSTIRELVINRVNRFHGINLGASNCIVEGCFIGTDASGTLALANAGAGIAVSGSNNLIGGTTLAARNIISGNGDNGISGQAASTNTVQGNFIGTDATGTNALHNATNGIVFTNGLGGNVIGGTSASARNIISGNVNSGVQLQDTGGDVLQGNFIGTDITGTKSLSNGVDGLNLRFGPGGNTIGGTTPGAGNVISANGRAGIVVESGEANNVVQGNFIGTDLTGTLTLGNADRGLIITDGNHTTVEGNVIAHNTLDGIGVRDSVSTNNRFLGNSIFGNGGLGIDLLIDGVTLMIPATPTPVPTTCKTSRYLAQSKSTGARPPSLACSTASPTRLTGSSSSATVRLTPAALAKEKLFLARPMSRQMEAATPPSTLVCRKLPAKLLPPLLIRMGTLRSFPRRLRAS
jgi:hypothetical protein